MDLTARDACCLNLFAISAKLKFSEAAPAPRELPQSLSAVFISACIPRHKQVSSLKVSVCDLHNAGSEILNYGDAISKMPNSAY